MKCPLGAAATKAKVSKIPVHATESSEVCHAKCDEMRHVHVGSMRCAWRGALMYDEWEALISEMCQGEAR